MFTLTGKVHFVTTPWIVIGLGKSTIGLEEIYRHQRMSKAQVLVAAGQAIYFRGKELYGCVRGDDLQIAQSGGPRKEMKRAQAHEKCASPVGI